jgi:hypothetical protein
VNGVDEVSDVSADTALILKTKNDFDLAALSNEDEAKLSLLITKTVQHMMEQDLVSKELLEARVSKEFPDTLVIKAIRNAL